TVTAQLSAASGLPITVPFTVGGTATNPADYTITASPITISPGGTTGTITITVVDDATPESSETVIVTIGTPTNATQGATTVHTPTITDNDTATLSVASLTGSDGGLTVQFNGTLDVAALNLYDTVPGGTLGAADVLLLASGGDGNFTSGNETRVRGSLVIDPA